MLAEVKKIQKEALNRVSKEWELPLPSYEWIGKIQEKITNIITFVSDGTYGMSEWYFKRGFLFIKNNNYWLNEKKLTKLGFRPYKNGWIKKIVVNKEEKVVKAA